MTAGNVKPMKEELDIFERMAESERNDPVPATQVKARVLASLQDHPNAKSLSMLRRSAPVPLAPFAWLTALSGLAAAVLLTLGLNLQPVPAKQSVEELDLFNLPEMELSAYDAAP